MKRWPGPARIPKLHPRPRLKEIIRLPFDGQRYNKAYILSLLICICYVIYGTCTNDII